MPRVRTYKPCKRCGNDLPSLKHRYRRVYCSESCYQDARQFDLGLPACQRCGTTRGSRRIRRLCPTCWVRIRNTDELADYPRVTRTSDEVIEEWQVLSAYGMSKREVAARLGMTYAAFDRALHRYNARQRARRTA